MADKIKIHQHIFIEDDSSDNKLDDDVTPLKSLVTNKFWKQYTQY